MVSKINSVYPHLVGCERMITARQYIPSSNSSAFHSSRYKHRSLHCGIALVDQSIKSVFGELLEKVQSHCCGEWFPIMASLYPAAWFLLWLSRIHLSSVTQTTAPSSS